MVQGIFRMVWAAIVRNLQLLAQTIVRNLNLQLPSDRRGYATEDSRQVWLQQRGFTEEEAAKISSSLEASTDPTKPIHFWQLFSVLGPDRIYHIVKKFYESVFADEEDTHFRDAFSRISGLDSHINRQTMFWIDAMGGGRSYHGGWHRLSFHHEQNARQVMNKDGAVRWMYHMNRALDSSDLTEDPRVKASIQDFLKTHMDAYADQYDFDTEGIEYAFADQSHLDAEGSRDREQGVRPATIPRAALAETMVYHDSDADDLCRSAGFTFSLVYVKVAEYCIPGVYEERYLQVTEQDCPVVTSRMLLPDISFGLGYSNHLLFFGLVLAVSMIIAGICMEARSLPREKRSLVALVTRVADSLMLACIFGFIVFIPYGWLRMMAWAVGEYYENRLDLNSIRAPPV